MSTFSLTPQTVDEAVQQGWTERPNRCIEISPTHAVAAQAIDQTQLRPGNFVPGPTLFALADLALWYLTFGAIDRIEPMALTSDLSIRFLRPAQGNTAYARADLDKAGRLMVVGTVKIWMDDAPERPVATAQGTYVLPRSS
ncbi:MAG: PaaI family thioesterase [Myxococcota bacterium]